MIEVILKLEPGVLIEIDNIIKVEIDGLLTAKINNNPNVEIEDDEIGV